MTPKWMSHLVQARQSQEDAAALRLAFARRAQTRAHARVGADKARLDQQGAGTGALDANAFVAAAVARQSTAATYAAALSEADRADAWVLEREQELTRAAVSRLTSEQLRDNAQKQLDEARARNARRDLDEAAAVGHERRRRELHEDAS